jgi:hypothetical protein
MPAHVTDEATKRLERVLAERKSQERADRKVIQDELAKAERREWSQRKFGDERH